MAHPDAVEFACRVPGATGPSVARLARCIPGCVATAPPVMTTTPAWWFGTCHPASTVFCLLRLVLRGWTRLPRPGLDLLTGACPGPPGARWPLMAHSTLRPAPGEGPSESCFTHIGGSVVVGRSNHTAGPVLPPWSHHDAWALAADGRRSRDRAERAGEPSGTGYARCPACAAAQPEAEEARWGGPGPGGCWPRSPWSRRLTSTGRASGHWLPCCGCPIAASLPTR